MMNRRSAHGYVHATAWNQSVVNIRLLHTGWQVLNCCKYKYNYKYSPFKYEYKYSGSVLEYNSSTTTSTKYYISAGWSKKADTQFYFWDDFADFGNSAPILTIFSLLAYNQKYMARKRVYRSSSTHHTFIV